MNLKLFLLYCVLYPSYFNQALTSINQNHHKLCY